MFQKPELDSFVPEMGPVSGGTKLTIHGKNLDVGSNLRITAAYLPCVPILYVHVLHNPQFT